MTYFTKLKAVLTIILILFISTLLIGQSNVTFEKLTKLLPLVKNHRSNVFYSGLNDDPLLQEVLKLNWDLDSNKTFEQLYEEVKDLSIDYRYYLLLSKMCNGSYRKDDTYNKFNNIDYYYKSLFLSVAIEKGLNLNLLHKDSLKYMYTNQYILSTINDFCFPSFIEFKEFADLNVKYCKDLLNNMRLNLTKDQRSELYYIVGDAIYRTKYLEEKDEKSLSDIFLYLSLAIKENPENLRAISARADYKKEHLLNYQAAIKDYLLLLNVLESENRKSIAVRSKQLSNNKNIINKKGYWTTRSTFERMIDIAECYLNLNQNNDALKWLDKAIVSIKEYRELNTYSEYASNYEGTIYYYKAIAHIALKDLIKACAEVETAINNGYDIEECKKLQLEMNCTSNTPLTNAITSIPMKKKNGVYEIPVVINGVLKLDFIFDAGAADISISPDIALTLIRTGTVKDEDFIGTENYKLADGSIVKSKVFLLKEIQLGDKKVNNMKASISNSLKSPLLLGQSVLNKFGKVTIDYNKGVIVFED